MPSFDVVSRINLQELDNALNQARKEISTRYDFQGTHAEIILSDDKTGVMLKANSEGRIQAAYDVLQTRLVKRGISLRALEPGPIEPAAMGHVKQLIKLQQGIPVEKGRELVKALKDSKLKVQGAIQGDQLRISGKSKDDLQAAIALFRQQQETLKLDMQFTNFRD
jgi:cyclic-di-GMP-binding protein